MTPHFPRYLMDQNGHKLSSRWVYWNPIAEFFVLVFLAVVVVVSVWVL